jgi:hypothetical protein
MTMKKAVGEDGGRGIGMMKAVMKEVERRWEEE